MSTLSEIELQTRREAIQKVYPGAKEWHDRVDKMSSAQVTAIYLRFKAQGKLKK